MDDRDFREMLRAMFVALLGAVSAVTLVGLLVLLCGCSTRRPCPGYAAAPVTLADSIAVERVHTERTDTAWAVLPLHTAERTAPADTAVSRLSTGYARSMAWLDTLGLLHHTLENRTDRPVPAPYTTAADTLRTFRYVDRPVYVDRVQSVPAQLTWWQQAQIYAGRALLLLLAAAIIINLIKKHFKQ